MLIDLSSETKAARLSLVFGAAAALQISHHLLEFKQVFFCKTVPLVAPTSEADRPLGQDEQQLPH